MDILKNSAKLIKSDKPGIKCAYILLGIQTVALIYLSKHIHIWYDEAFSLKMMEVPMGQMIEYLKTDVHPPLYYILLKLMTSIFGNNIFVAHITSLVPTIITAGILIRFTRKYISKEWIMPICIAFFAIPQNLGYALEIRMYSLALLMVTCYGIQMFFCLKVPEEKKYFIYAAIFGVLAAYTHYFAGVFVGICTLIYLGYFLLTKNKAWKYIILHIIIMFLVYLPWLPVFYLQFFAVKDNFWLTIYTIEIAKSVMPYLFGETGSLQNICYIIFLGFVVVMIGLYWMRKVIKKIEGEERLFPVFIMISFIGTIALGLVISWIMRPIFQAKYIFPAVALLWLAIFIIISISKNKIIYYLCLACFLVGWVIQWNNLIEYAIDDDMKTVQGRYDGEEVIFVHNSSHIMGCFSVYFPYALHLMQEDVLQGEYFEKWAEYENIDTYNNIEEISEIKEMVVFVGAGVNLEYFFEDFEQSDYRELEVNMKKYNGIDVTLYEKKK